MDSLNNNFKSSFSMVNLMVTEKDFAKYAQSINKSLTGLESPVKAKHLRFIVVGTFREQGAKSFWSVALRTSYLDDRIVAWKLCYVVHKILREGHPLCLEHTLTHRNELREIGNLWKHLRGPFSQAIHLYTNFLVTKIDFHSRNPRIPGNLVLLDEELKSILSDDINNFFQLAVEIFDYLDRLLELQLAIFGPFNITDQSSEVLSASDQCLISPIILCLQDASKLYDYSVKIMYRLHSSIPEDVISGHRVRFVKVFEELKEFYKKGSKIAFLRNIVTIPDLPEEPPDFCTESNLYSYVIQEVSFPEEPIAKNIFSNSSLKSSSEFSGRYDETSEETLIDIRGDDFNRAASYNISPSAPIYESIETYQNIPKENVSSSCSSNHNVENVDERFKQKLDLIISNENQQIILSLENRISELEVQLEEKTHQLNVERQMRETLQNSTIPELPYNSNFGLSSERNKITNLYSKLRNDYIEVLKKNGELQKQIHILETKLAETENESFI